MAARQRALRLIYGFTNPDAHFAAQPVTVGVDFELWR